MTEVFMKKFILISFVFIALGISSSINAQSALRLRAQIPFAFSVGHDSFPAGTYELKIIRFGASSGVLRLTNDEGKIVDTLTVSGSSDAVSVDDTNLQFVGTNDLSLVKVFTNGGTFTVQDTK